MEEATLNDEQWFNEQSDMALIRENMEFFERVQRGEPVYYTITRHQSARMLKMGLTFRGWGNHCPLRLTGYAARLLEQVQQESPLAETPQDYAGERKP